MDIAPSEGMTSIRCRPSARETGRERMDSSRRSQRRGRPLDGLRPRRQRPALLLGRGLLLGLVLLALAPGAWGQRSITVGDCDFSVNVDYPREGQSCQIQVLRGGAPLPDASIFATFRPNSAVETTVLLGTTDATGCFDWTPDHPGITTLTVREAEGELASLTVSVEFAGIPILGLLVMLGAAGILFGGNSYSFAKTFGKS